MTARKRALCLLLLGLLLLTGCSGGESAAIEGVTWELVRVQSLEDGAVVYCLPEAQSLWPDAAPLTEEILCTALDGTLRLARGETERTAAYAPLEDGSAGEGTRVLWRRAARGRRRSCCAGRRKSSPSRRKRKKTKRAAQPASRKG